MADDEDNDAQLGNFIKNIKSRASSGVDSAELAKIIIEIEGKLGTNLSPEAEKILQTLLDSVREQKEGVDKRQASQNLSSNEELGSKEDNETQKLTPVEEEHDKIYAEFNATHETELEKKDADMKVLDAELSASKGLKIISPTKDQKQIEEEEKRKEEKKKHYQHIVKTSETTQVAYDMHTENITRLDREIASTHDPKKLKALKAERTHHLERQGKASETKKKVNIHVDKLLEEKELIDKGKKIAKEKGVNLEHWEKREQDFADIFLADNGKLLSERKRAQQKNDGGEKHLEDLSLSQKPKVLGMKEKLQQKQTGANLSSGPFRPSNTPNVKDSTSSKGHGGPGG